MSEAKGHMQLPDGWNSKKLEDVLDYVIGGDWGKDEQYADPEFELAYCIRAAEIKNWSTEKGKTAALRKIKKRNIEKRTLLENDIIIEISGGGPEQPVGRTVLIDKQVLSFQPSIPKICTNFFRLMRPNNRVNSKYLNTYLNYFYRSGKIVEFQAGSNNLRNLKFPDYIKLQIPLPPLPTQRAIVSKIEELFSELDKGIEQLKTAQQQLKTYRQAVLKYAFEGRLTHAEVKEGELPEGWKWVKLKEITSVLGDGLHGTPNYAEMGEYYFINGNNLSEGRIVFRESTKRVDFEEYLKHKKNLNESTVLVSINGTLGNTAFYNNEKVILGKSACYFNLKPEVNKYYIRYVITSQRFLNYAQETATGSTIPNVSLKSMREFEVPLTSIEEQAQIVQAIESRLSVADKLEESIRESLQKAELLRQSILKRAFEGRLV